MTSVRNDEHDVSSPLRHFLGVIFLIALALAVDHDTFRTCEQVDFCRQVLNYLERNLLKLQIIHSRLRGKGDTSNFQVVSGTISIGVSAVSVHLIDTNTADRYQLNISAIQGDIFRVRIQELDFDRYNLPYALDGEPTLAEYVIQLVYRTLLLY